MFSPEFNPKGLKHLRKLILEPNDWVFDSNSEYGFMGFDNLTTLIFQGYVKRPCEIEHICQHNPRIKRLEYYSSFEYTDDGAGGEPWYTVEG